MENLTKQVLKELKSLFPAPLLFTSKEVDKHVRSAKLYNRPIDALKTLREKGYIEHVGNEKKPKGQIGGRPYWLFKLTEKAMNTDINHQALIPEYREPKIPEPGPGPEPIHEAVPPPPQKQREKVTVIFDARSGTVIIEGPNSVIEFFGCELDIKLR